MRKPTKNDYVNFIECGLQPNVYVVATLRQAKTCFDGAIPYRIIGTRDRYSQAYDQFIKRLSIAVYGKANWRKYRRIFPNAKSFEGQGFTKIGPITRKGKRPYDFQSGRAGVRNHINMHFRRPDWIPFEEFEAILRSTWAKSDWGLPDIKIEERTGNSVAYSLKEGPEAFDPNSMSF